MTEQDLIDVVAIRDVPCPTCQYNLRGIRRGYCPECGTALVLTVAPRTHFPTAWLLAVIASGIIASHLPDAIRHLSWVTANGFKQWWWDRTMVIHYGSVGFLLALIGLLLNRHRFVRFAAWLQWLVAGIFLFFAAIHLMIRWQWIEWS